MKEQQGGRRVLRVELDSKCQVNRNQHKERNIRASSRLSLESWPANSTSTKSTFNFWSVLTPIKRGEPRRAVTISLGKWGDLKTNAKEPSSSLRTALINSVKVRRLDSPWESKMYLVRIATASVSVSLSNLYPRFCKTCRKAALLVTMPLWTRMNSDLGSERTGWQLRSEGGPWVAHRVCAIETCAVLVFSTSRLDAAIFLRRPATLPTSLKYSTDPGLSPSMTRPAESYPRYSWRARPAHRISRTSERDCKKYYIRLPVKEMSNE